MAKRNRNLSIEARRALSKAGRKGGLRGSTKAKSRAGKKGWQAMVKKMAEAEASIPDPAPTDGTNS